MNRRLVLLSAAATPFLADAFLRSAVAQTAPSSATPLDMAQHKLLTLRVGTLSKEMSELARQRARNGHVKEFAGFEYDEQTTIARVLTDQPTPPPAPLPPPMQTMLRQLRETADGPAFDHAYIANEIIGHDELLSIQRRFLHGQTTMGSDAAHVAMLARMVIEMHITMLHGIQNMMQA